MRRILKWGAACSSIGIVGLSLLFIFGHHQVPLSNETIWIMSIMVVLPAISMLIAILTNKPILSILSFIWSVPYTLYVGAAAWPTIWNLFVLGLFIELLYVTHPAFFIKHQTFVSK